MLPSAITDNPNPAVVDFPAYQDVRVKSVRILGLQPGDLLEYRVITTTTHHPLAPDFWLDHTFDRSGVVTEEIFELDMPASRRAQIRINPNTPADSNENSGDGDTVRTAYHWHRRSTESTTAQKNAEEPDVLVSSFASWRALSRDLADLLNPSPAASRDVLQAPAARKPSENDERLYAFVSKEIKTVDLPLGATGFRTRLPKEILASGYANPEDKYALFRALAFPSDVRPALAGSGVQLEDKLPSPALLSEILIQRTRSCAPRRVSEKVSEIATHCSENYWLVPSLEIAPYGAIPPSTRGKQALVAHDALAQDPFVIIKSDASETAKQIVKVQAMLAADGTLTAKVTYTMHGDNELLLRVAFHKTEKEKWKDVAQMLALSDGFRGQIVNVTASDPYAIKEPFTVEYEISQPKFVDWSKKIARIPAILPLPGLPDAPTAEQIKSGKSIELGTPLSIDLESAVELPAGTTAQAPIGTAVDRDYATFSSKYSAQGNTLHATRKLNFIAREIPAARAGDLNAFLHAMQSDQSQLFSLQPPTQK